MINKLINWNEIADSQTIAATIVAVKSRGINVILVDTKEDALTKIKDLIPKGSEVMNGSSTTLNEIGYADLLKSGKHGWKNMHEEILKETDWPRQSELRRKATTAEYFLGSLNAISKNGELIAVDATGSRVGAYLFSAKNLILVAGANKIADSLEDGMRRVREHVFPLEDARAQKTYGMGSRISKWAIIEHEVNPKRITLILVKEKLGF